MQCRVCIPNRRTDGCSNILLRIPGAHPDHERPRTPRPKSDPARCATTTPRCAGGALAALVGERNAATAMPGNPRPTTTHSPAPQLVKVPGARTGDRPTSPRPVTPTRLARRLSGRPSARARPPRSRRCSIPLRTGRPPALGAGGARRPTTPPPIRLLLAGRRAVHQQTTRPRQRPRQPSTALRALIHTQYRHAPRQCPLLPPGQVVGIGPRSKPVIRSAGQRRRYTSRRCSAARTVTTPACSSMAYSTR